MSKSSICFKVKSIECHWKSYGCVAYNFYCSESGDARSLSSCSNPLKNTLDSFYSSVFNYTFMVKRPLCSVSGV